jgi:hypothetical protein
MKVATLKEIKTELNTLFPARVIDICMLLARYKKENKELLTYLLFESSDKLSYVKEVKSYIDEQFEGMNTNNLYLSKKTLRKILRATTKYIRYSGSKQTEVELLIYFCKKVRSSGIPLHHNKTLSNFYARQITKIEKAFASLHEDLQYDYSVEIKSLL